VRRLDPPPKIITNNSLGQCRAKLIMAISSRPFTMRDIMENARNSRVTITDVFSEKVENR